MTENGAEVNAAVEAIPAVHEVEPLSRWGIGSPRGGRGLGARPGREGNQEDRPIGLKVNNVESQRRQTD